MSQQQDSGLILIQHHKETYGPRTAANAKKADWTLAFALNYNTAGEVLTKKVAGASYRAIPLSTPLLQAARDTYSVVAKFQAHGAVLNIAGNSLHTLAGKGWSQERVNGYLYVVLGEVARHLRISKIVSGGQTGTDLAGAIAGVALGIPTEMCFPLGFKQRNEHGVDALHSEEEIREQVSIGVEALEPWQAVLYAEDMDLAAKELLASLDAARASAPRP